MMNSAFFFLSHFFSRVLRFSWDSLGAVEKTPVYGPRDNASIMQQSKPGLSSFSQGQHSLLPMEGVGGG